MFGKKAEMYCLIVTMSHQQEPRSTRNRSLALFVTKERVLEESAPRCAVLLILQAATTKMTVLNEHTQNVRE